MFVTNWHKGTKPEPTHEPMSKLHGLVLAWLLGASWFQKFLKMPPQLNTIKRLCFSFEEFATVVCEDKRSANLDAGNVKLTYNALLEKAETKDKERMKEEGKKLRKLEGELRAIFTELNVEDNSLWSEVKSGLADKEVYQALTEEQAEKMFRDYQKDLGETCFHNHGKRKSKKSKKKKKASSSDSDSDQSEKRKSRKRSKKDSESSDSDSDSDHHKKKKKKKKRTKARSISDSRSPASSDADDSYGTKKSKKKKGTPSLSPSPARRAASPMRSVSPNRRRGREASPKRRQRSPSDESIEEGELSEDELERKRMQLLKQLQEDD